MGHFVANAAPSIMNSAVCLFVSLFVVVSISSKLDCFMTYAVDVLVPITSLFFERYEENVVS